MLAPTVVEEDFQDVVTRAVDDSSQDVDTLAVVGKRSLGVVELVQERWER